MAHCTPCLAILWNDVEHSLKVVNGLAQCLVVSEVSLLPSTGLLLTFSKRSIVRCTPAIAFIAGTE